MIEHGGNIYRASEETGIPEKRILDFSASINPLGVPNAASMSMRTHIAQLVHYPDPDARDFIDALAMHYKIAPESILCGNGSTELIYLIVRALRPRSVVIPYPTFSEYKRAVRTYSFNHRDKKLDELITFVPCEADHNFALNTDAFVSSLRGHDMAFLCNPNNPTGQLLKREEVLTIANAARRVGCLLVVDEAFIDFCPKHSVIEEVVNNPFLVVLRSMTKFYALSGLRLGFGVFSLHDIEFLKRYKEPWSVNSLALTAGIAALKDKEYRKKAFLFMKKEKQFLEAAFKGIGIPFIPSSANFYLLKLSNAADIVHTLYKKGILVRHCANFKGLANSYIRVAVKSRKDNMRLLKELALCRES